MKVSVAGSNNWQLISWKIGPDPFYLEVLLTNFFEQNELFSKHVNFSNLSN